MDVVIKNSTDLKLEIQRLKAVNTEQEIAIKQHFSSPRAILGTIISFFGKNKPGEEPFSLAKYDISSLISKYVLPLVLSKTLFRKSNFIIKAIVGLASSKAGGLLNDKRVSSLWDKIKTNLPNNLIEKILPKKPSSFFSFLSPKKSSAPKRLKAAN